MATLRVEPELYSRIEQAAQAQNTSAEVLLGEVVRRCLWEMDRCKISEASAVHRRRHSELKAKYPYNKKYQSPFPSVPFVLHKDEQGLRTESANAFLDTGSDGSLTSLKVVFKKWAHLPNSTVWQEG